MWPEELMWEVNVAWEKFIFKFERTFSAFKITLVNSSAMLMHSSEYLTNSLLYWTVQTIGKLQYFISFAAALHKHTPAIFCL